MSPIIKVEQLSKTYKVPEREGGFGAAVRSFFKRTYKDVKAVQEVNFNIEQGEVVGFLGPNGAGKTTTLKMLSGLLHPTGGKAHVLGFTPWKLEPAKDHGLSLRESFRSLRRENGLVMTGLHMGWWSVVRTYLAIWHRLRIHGKENIPKKPPFVLVANHASHLDTLVLAATVPWSIRGSIYPIAAGDVFFETPTRSAPAPTARPPPAAARRPRRARRAAARGPRARPATGGCAPAEASRHDA